MRAPVGQVPQSAVKMAIVGFITFKAVNCGQYCASEFYAGEDDAVSSLSVQIAIAQRSALDIITRPSLFSYFNAFNVWRLGIMQATHDWGQLLLCQSRYIVMLWSHYANGRHIFSQC